MPIGAQMLARLQAGAMVSVVVRVAARVVEAAQQNAPQRTGRLQHSLRVEDAAGITGRETAASGGGNDASTPGVATAFVVCDAPYALSVETDTPFLRPALTSIRHDFLSDLKDTLR